jgi:hypothetical protein
MISNPFHDLPHVIDFFKTEQEAHNERIQRIHNLVNDFVSLGSTYRVRKQYTVSDMLRKVLESNDIKVIQSKNSMKDVVEFGTLFSKCINNIGTIYQTSDVLNYIKSTDTYITTIKKYHYSIITEYILCYRYFYNIQQKEISENIETVLVNNNIKIIYGTCMFNGWDNIPKIYRGDFGHDTFEVIK